MPKKDVFLTKEQIEYIDKNYNGKYSEYCRIAAEEKIERTEDDWFNKLERTKENIKSIRCQRTVEPAIYSYSGLKVEED